MDVIVAKTAGFCFGVKRAVETVYEELKSGEPIYTYGPIIHNEEVVRELSEKGVRVVNSPKELEELEKGAVVIRSHGVSEEIYKRLEATGMRIVDATCPFVKRIHNVVNSESKKGCEIVIIGDDGHPEVEGIKGWSERPAKVIADKAESLDFEPISETKICCVSQTTYNYKNFQEIIEIFSKKGYDVNVVNTICNATEERQTEAAEIARDADMMIVIGSRTSSNSRKLYEICRQHCSNTFFIQTADDLEKNLMGNARKIGITAGASTPNNIIEEVQNYVRINF